MADQRVKRGLRGQGSFSGLVLSKIPSRNTLLGTIITVVIALIISVLLTTAVGVSPGDSLRALYLGSVANASSWSLTLLHAAPLLLVAVGSCIAFQAGVFNIGQEGQVLIGALAATWVAIAVPVSGVSLLVATLIVAVVAGGLWSLVSSLLYWWRGVNIIVSTLLMTFIAIPIIGFAVNKDWWLQATRIGNSVVESQSDQVPESARLDSLGQYPNLQINGGLIIAIALTVLVAVWLFNTQSGLRIKMMGLSRFVARHAGVRTGRLSTLTLGLAGGFAGLAGAVLISSPVSTNRLQPGTANNVGWDGLLIVLVARSNPLIAIPVAVLFGALRAGGGFLASAGIPSPLVDVIKALLVLAFVLPPIAVRWFERRQMHKRRLELERSMVARRQEEGLLS